MRSRSGRCLLGGVSGLFGAMALAFASPASAVTMDWTPVGNAGNACETQSQGCFGAVGYDYLIGTYEVTNAQYAEFLNAKAPSDPLALYNTSMGSGQGGITRSGSSGSYTYSTIAGRADMPVNYVSFYDALRFANWLNNGQGSGDTETGAYTLLGGSPTPINASLVTRNSGANIFLTSEDEWYKAAYHDAIGLSATNYFDYPAASNTVTTCTAPTAVANSANCDASGTDPSDADVDDLTVRGSFGGSASPHGTFDQGGNVWEWNEAAISGDRGMRGGTYLSSESFLAASQRFDLDPTAESDVLGFRVAMVPEPGTGLLVTMGLLGFACRRRNHD